MKAHFGKQFLTQIEVPQTRLNCTVRVSALADDRIKNFQMLLLEKYILAS